MGIEPFFIPKRDPAKDARTAGAGESRDDKIMTLARLLHSRGLTSSMADAKRLAEGMVTIERQVIKQSPSPSSPAPAPTLAQTKADAPTATAQASSSQSLRFPSSFSQFIAEVQTKEDRAVPYTAPRMERPAARVENTSDRNANDRGVAPVQTQQQAQQTEANTIKQKSPSAAELLATANTPMRYGRDDERVAAQVPHIMPRKQIFFEDAPPLSAARGYTGPERPNVDFLSQREQVMRRLVPDEPMNASEPVRSAQQPTIEIREETADDVVETVRGTVEEEEEDVVASTPARATNVEETGTHTRIVHEETSVEQTSDGVAVTRVTESAHTRVEDASVIIADTQDKGAGDLASDLGLEDVSPKQPASVEHEEQEPEPVHTEPQRFEQPRQSVETRREPSQQEQQPRARLSEQATVKPVEEIAKPAEEAPPAKKSEPIPKVDLFEMFKKKT